MNGTDKLTTTIEFFQTGGPDETLEAATKKFLAGNPGRQVLEAKFEYAYPGRPGEGRTVGIAITHVLDRTYAHAD